jgi:hypothetical protein
MKKIVFLCLILGLCQMAYSARKAFVVGNSDYTDRPLQNPVADAELISNSLTEVGFSVQKLTNADRNEFNREFNKFAQSLNADDEVVFFFSGHGVQINSVNYLLPIREHFADEMDIIHKAVSMDWVNEKLSPARISLVFLDACRDNPYSSYRGSAPGLATINYSRNEMFVMYSTGTGEVASDGSGPNSVFSRALAENIVLRGLSIDEIGYRVCTAVTTASNGNQTPWRSNNIKAPYYFSPGVELKTEPQSPFLYSDNSSSSTPIFDQSANKGASSRRTKSDNSHLLRNLRLLTSTEYNTYENLNFSFNQLVSRNRLTLKIPWFGIEGEYNVYDSQEGNLFGAYASTKMSTEMSLGLGLPDPDELRLFAKVSLIDRYFLHPYSDEYKEQYKSFRGEFAKRVSTENQRSELFINYSYNDLPSYFVPTTYMNLQANISSGLLEAPFTHEVEVGALLGSITNPYQEPLEFQGISPDSRPLLLMDKAGALFSAKFLMKSRDQGLEYDYDLADDLNYLINYPQNRTGAEFRFPLKFSRYFGIQFGYDHYRNEYFEDTIDKSTENILMGSVNLSLLDFSFIKLVATGDYINFEYNTEDEKESHSQLKGGAIAVLRPWKCMAIHAHYQLMGEGIDISDAMSYMVDNSFFGVGFSLRI